MQAFTFNIQTLRNTSFVLFYFIFFIDLFLFIAAFTIRKIKGKYIT